MGVLLGGGDGDYCNYNPLWECLLTNRLTEPIQNQVFDDARIIRWDCKPRAATEKTLLYIGAPFPERGGEREAGRKETNWSLEGTTLYAYLRWWSDWISSCGWPEKSSIALKTFKKWLGRSSFNPCRGVQHPSTRNWWEKRKLHCQEFTDSPSNIWHGLKIAKIWYPHQIHRSIMIIPLHMARNVLYTFKTQNIFSHTMTHLYKLI